MTCRIFFLVISTLLTVAAYGQDNSLHKDKFTEKYLEAVSKKSSQLNQKLDKKSGKTLARLQKQEERLKQRLSKIDSLAAISIFADSKEKYAQLREKLKSGEPLSLYIPQFDTAITALKFLEQTPGLVEEGKEIKEKLNNAISNVKELEAQLQKAENIRKFLKERQRYLAEQLKKSGLSKELKKINKEVYYYSEQLKEYKGILSDRKKIEQKTIELLSKTKFFQEFMRKNSMLASLFRMPGNPGDPAYQANLAGLQTRVQVNALIQNQIAIGGPGAQQQIQNNIQQAQAQLQQLKDKVNKWGGGSSDDIMPEGFKPNSQKIKSFLQRLELGTDIQTQRANNIFPVTSDLGLSVGYRPNDKSVVGIGMSSKIGWGSGWRNIRFSYQGIGLRSYLDWKLKGNFWISGGFEMNYRSVIRNFDQLQEQSGWQRSGLIGISKTVSVKSKLFKKTKAQLLWDYLAHRQIPRAQSIIFRIGYNIK